MPRKWFQNWFNSPYYHILYQQRNDEEAEFFIDNLCAHIKPGLGSRLLDMACGRGRHSVYLNKKGYDVTGTDLSFANIRFAQQFENEKLHFYVHDIRYLFYIKYFDVALSMFNSFGYFETQKDHINALKTLRKSLKPDGILVLDYLNTDKILRNLTQQEIKRADGIDFHISKRASAGKIIKTISFEHKNKDFSFKEEVKAFTFADFEIMFQKSGFKIVDHYGDYALNAFDPTRSEHLIFICAKADA